MNSSLRFLLQRDALAIESLRHGGSLRLRVHGQSMLPTVWPGDVVEVQASTLRNIDRGDLVLAYRDEHFILHRYIAESGDGFVLRGDSMPCPDPEYPPGSLLGKAIRVERSGSCGPPRRFGWLSRILGQVICHSDWMRHIALRLHQMRLADSNGAAVNDIAADICPCEEPS